ncbi:Hypothetical protein AJAP_28140 [Amycolatopsis japonica]|uniref:Tail assembly chaperone n=1 Tax=Amycolatopsis japonica TaxID=208439 RepID=A0A075V1C8_9PSEU|nr:phage tail assembly protein [Amycolatopsis japonica]AIG78466.1 Hypothetical protein AJAP_28140 [Amycolatopsis japonica]
MTNTYSLDSLKADLDKEFAPLKLEVAGEELVLRNLMRVGEKDREAVLGALKAVEALNIDEENTSPEDISVLARHIETILVIVTANGKGQKLADAVNGDVALSMRIVELWVEATQPGEAENSPA